MTRAKLEQWLDKQVELYNEVRNNQALLDDDEQEYSWMLAGYTDGIHISHPKMVARFLEIPIQVVELSDVEYPYKVKFWYRGVSFFGLYTEEDFKNE